jgi:hypothetical protein
MFSTYCCTGDFGALNADNLHFMILAQAYFHSSGDHNGLVLPNMLYNLILCLHQPTKNRLERTSTRNV